ncbi:30S ribosomal protein S13 [Microgenomates group bacterium RIFCSPLOWO2_01_FULL_46_13]|nr:MAG: 30S ribosomal protein S13 [Microgenomates group bacterium RIFCSPLOWO2_01_FULL_46_13]
MPRIVGVDIPENKRAEVALTYIFGVGRTNVKSILDTANVDSNKRAKDLTAEEIARLQKVLEAYTLEGNLRKQVRENIDRLKRVGAYRGQRHLANLPVRGQRTRVNARTKRGKRRTVGALKKEDAVKSETVKGKE